MPILAALLGSAFISVVTWLSTYISKKLAVGAALATFLIGGAIALQLGLRALWESISFAVPVFMEAPLSVVAYLLPSNMSACVQAIILAKVARWLWDRQKEWGLAMAQV